MSWFGIMTQVGVGTAVAATKSAETRTEARIDIGWDILGVEGGKGVGGVGGGKDCI